MNPSPTDVLRAVAEWLRQHWEAGDLPGDADRIAELVATVLDGEQDA